MTNPSPSTVQLDISEWKFTEELPHLTENNYIKWKSRIIDLLKPNRFQLLLKKDFDFNNVREKALKQNVEQGDSVIHLLIAKRIPDDLESVLPPYIYYMNYLSRSY